MTVYSGWVATDDWRTGVNAWVSSQTDTTATITVQCIFDNVYCAGSNSSSGNIVRTGCDGATKSTNISLGTNYGHYRNAVVKTDTYTVSKSSSARNVAVSAYIYVGASLYRTGATASTTVSVAAISYGKPAAPTSVSTAYESDTSIKTTWSNGAVTTTTPRSETYVYRAVDGASWTKIATVGASTTNYTDTSTTADHKYRYGVAAHGAGGTSSTIYGADVYTSPAAPTYSVEKSGVRDAVLAFSSTAAYNYGYEVEVSEDSKATWAAGTYSVNADGTVSMFDLPAGTCYLRVRCTVLQEGNVLYSEWVESEEIVTITAPLAPAVWWSSEVLAVSEAASVSWVPNHPDATAQTKAQVEVIDPSGSSTVHDVGGSVTSYAIEPATTGAWKARVRTHGLSDDWGAWSAFTSAAAYVAPICSIDAPADGSTITALPYTAEWAAMDDTGIVSQTLTLTGPDYSRPIPVSSAARAATLTGSHGLSTGSDYTLTLTVTAGSSLSATAASTFTTEWMSPTKASASLEVDGEACAVELVVNAGEPSGSEVEAVSFDVARKIGSDVVVFAEGVGDGYSVVDPLPPLNTDYSYVITAHAESGSTSIAYVPAYVESGAVMLNFGPDAGEFIRCAYNLDWSRSREHGSSLYRFMDGTSDSYPVRYADGTSSETQSVSCAIPQSDYARVCEISEEYGEGWLRDLAGGRAFGSVSLPLELLARGWWTLKPSFERTRWEEPLNG